SQRTPPRWRAPGTARDHGAPPASVERLEERCVLEVAEGEGERVRSVRRQRLGEAEALPHPPDDRVLVGLAVTDRRELHRGRCVLVEGDARGPAHRQHRTTRLAEAQRALHVAGDERPLERDRRGAPRSEEPPAFLTEAREAHGELVLPLEHERPAPQVADCATLLLDDTPPRQPASRIDPEDPHPASAAPLPAQADSRSSSSGAMSMFEDTLCTSSWSSSASSSRTVCSAGFPEIGTVDWGIMVISAEAIGTVACCSAVRTASNFSGALNTSRMSPASRTSSAPASRATSMTRSSSTRARSTVTSPRFWNIQATL